MKQLQVLQKSTEGTSVALIDKEKEKRHQKRDCKRNPEKQVSQVTFFYSLLKRISKPLCRDTNRQEKEPLKASLAHGRCLEF